MWRLMLLMTLFAVPAFSESVLTELPGSLLPKGYRPIFMDEAASGVFEWVSPVSTSATKLPYNGWVSRYGALDGGVYFFTDLFELSPTSHASIWWDFTGAAFPEDPYDDFWELSIIKLYGEDPDGVGSWRNFRVREPFRTISPGRVEVGLEDHFTLMTIGFFGGPRVHVPEPSVIAMLSFALGLLLAMRARRFPGRSNH